MKRVAVVGDVEEKEEEEGWPKRKGRKEGQERAIQLPAHTPHRVVFAYLEGRDGLEDLGGVHVLGKREL